ncbi:MAG: hypothetical protein AAF363_07770 [Bacteroidota bacterium]
MTTYRLIFSAFFSLLCTINLSAQQNDTIMQAMVDELERNMVELKMEGHKKPFYISYGLFDGTTVNVSASLGGILYSASTPFRSKNVRVMVGDYNFNDESLNSQFEESFTYGFDFWSVPMENDYYGLRSSLWKSTDNIYKTAAKLYEEHLELLNRKDSSAKDFEYRKFAKLPARELTIESQQESVDAKMVESLLRDVSSKFKTFPKITESNVYFNQNTSTFYFTDSEESRVKVSSQTNVLAFVANRITDQGETVAVYDYLVSSKAEDLFNAERIDKTINSLISEMEKNINSRRFDESYVGPVLFLDEAVPSLFSNILYNFSTSDIKDANNAYLGPTNAKAIDHHIGSRIGSRSLTIKLTPRLEEYAGTSLIGAYHIDNEGVIPDEEIILLENGIAKNVMTSRTLTKPTHKPTGTESGPGVVHISFDGESNESNLREQLLELADEEGYDYGIIVRKMSNTNLLGVFKLNADGTEEYYRNALVNGFGQQFLRKVKNGLKEQNVYNIAGGSGVTSYIVPKGLLVKDVNIEPSSNQTKTEKPLVPNPLGFKK